MDTRAFNPLFTTHRRYFAIGMKYHVSCLKGDIAFHCMNITRIEWNSIKLTDFH